MTCRMSDLERENWQEPGTLELGPICLCAWPPEDSLVSPSFACAQEG